MEWTEATSKNLFGDFEDVANDPDDPSPPKRAKVVPVTGGNDDPTYLDYEDISQCKTVIEANGVKLEDNNMWKRGRNIILKTPTEGGNPKISGHWRALASLLLGLTMTAITVLQ